VNAQLAPGDIVRFARVFEAGDEAARFEVLEIRGVRALVADLDPAFAEWTIRPTCVHLVIDLVRADD
jgi:hypothetical protein